MATKITVERGPSSLTLTQSWSRPLKWILLVFSLLWNTIVIGFLLSGFPWFMILHAALGLGLAYFTLLLFVNKTVLTAGTRQLSVKHGPLPSLSKDHDLAVNSIAQLFLKRTRMEKQGKSGPSKPVYGLAAKLNTGVEVTLINGFYDPERVREIERTIEEYLGIQDAPVPVSDGLNLKPLKDLLPDRWAKKVEVLETRARQQLEAERNEHGATPHLDALFNAAGELPRHDVAGHFPLYRAGVGDRLRFHRDPLRLERAAQIDWNDRRVITARQLHLRREDNGEDVFLYTEYDGNRWNYLEERRLTGEETAQLGFTGQDHLISFENGSDKFYPREEQRGRRFFADGTVQEVEQFIYFTVRDQTQFRALRPAGGDWELYVQEAVDSGDFDGY